MSESKRVGFFKSAWVKRFFSAVLVIVYLIIAITEIAWFCTYVVPIVANGMFDTSGYPAFLDSQGLSVETFQNMALSDFKVFHLCILFMCWFLPCLFLVIFSATIHYKVFMFFWRKLFCRARFAIRGNVSNASNDSEQNEAAH